MGESRKEHIKKITSIGGSALIEGIMMRGPKKTMVAVRTGENEIYTQEVEFHSLAEKCKIFKIPLIRGIAGLIDSMRLSYKSLMISADKAIDSIPEDEQEEPSKLEKWIDEKLGDKFIKVLMMLASIVGVAVAIVLFFMLPTWLYNLISGALGGADGLSWMGDRFFRSLFEGVIRIGLFLLYIILCTQMSDMKRVFQYHGAEHKTIFCYESDEPLTVENVRKHTRFHPRCGTSFLLIVMLVSMIVFVFIRTDHIGLRLLSRILLVPFVSGISYEIIKWAGRSDNKVVQLLSKPGLWLQRLTTREPDASQIEVAIKSMEAVSPQNSEDDKW